MKVPEGLFTDKVYDMLAGVPDERRIVMAADIASMDGFRWSHDQIDAAFALISSESIGFGHSRETISLAKALILVDWMTRANMRSCLGGSNAGLPEACRGYRACLDVDYPALNLTIKHPNGKMATLTATLPKVNGSYDID